MEMQRRFKSKLSGGQRRLKIKEFLQKPRKETVLRRRK